MKKHEEHKPVHKAIVHKELAHKEHAVHHTHDKKKKFLMVGIAVLIVLIIGIIVATIVLTKTTKVTDTQDLVVPVTPVVDTTTIVTPPITGANLTLDDFKVRYESLMLKNNELNAKIQPEFLIELDIAQKPVFDAITTKLNLNKSQMDSCLASNNQLSEIFNPETADILKKIYLDTQFGQSIGVSGTPAILVNGQLVGGYVAYTDLKKAIDDAIDGNVVIDELYDANDTYFGVKNAKVVVYLFSDYYCSYCKKLAEESITLLKTEYINTNKIKFVPKDFIRVEPSAAIYARCAQEQNKYFEAEAELFSNSETLSSNLDAAQTKITDKYSTEINEFEAEVAILQKWSEENPEEFKLFQESLNAQAQ
ncbi:MAG: thioredoxin domain-containing protein [archaeon]|jgi:protein-disulfide isomerase